MRCFALGECSLLEHHWGGRLMVTLGIVVCSCQLGGPKIVDTMKRQRQIFTATSRQLRGKSDVHSDVFSTSQWIQRHTLSLTVSARQQHSMQSATCYSNSVRLSVTRWYCVKAISNQRYFSHTVDVDEISVESRLTWRHIKARKVKMTISNN